MSTAEFESLLKEVVNAKRLSASKMANLTELAMKNMVHDTKLVSILYRTHKTLSNSTSKVFSLYIFDALSRAAKHHSTKNGLTGDAFTNPGNSASFLFKIGGVVEGLFQDLVTTGSTEAKEKTRKILDIWVKGNTFPATILSQLADVVNGTQKVSDTPASAVPTATIPSFVPAAPTIDPRTVQTANTPTIITPVTTTFPAMDQHAALLALLTQAANVPIPRAQTSAPVAPQLDAAQLAVIQQLAHTAASVPSVPKYLPPPDRVNVQNFPSSSGLNGSAQSPPSYRNEPRTMVIGEQKLSGYRSPGSEPRSDPHFDERDNMRGRYRADYRNRGPGERFGRAWDPRDRDHHRADSDLSPQPVSVRAGRLGGGRSRSRSPGPSSRYNGRKDSRYSSPPPRRSTVSPTRGKNESAKDEFGRDIRPESPISPPPVKMDSPSPVSTAPKLAVLPERHNTPRAPLAATTNHESSNGSNSVSSLLVNANTSSVQQSSAQLVTDKKEVGMEKFNPATFNFTSPADWEALGKMWQVTHGYLPSTEELMQFVMACAAGPTLPKPNMTPQEFQSNHVTSGIGRGRGRGRGGFAGGRTSYGNGRGSFSEGESGYGYAHQAQGHTDAIVLEEGVLQKRNMPHTTTKSGADNNWTQTSTNGSTTNSNSAGGRMQRVGDKWVFVRGATDPEMDGGS